MKQLPANRTPKAGIWTRSALVAVAFTTATFGASAAGSPSDAAPTALPKALSWIDRGFSDLPPTRFGGTRVRIILSDQDILEAASSQRFQSLVRSHQPSRLQVVANRHPGRITRLEKTAARRGERRYERAVGGLSVASRSTDADLDRIARRVRGAGGTVLDRELLPAAIVARVTGKRLESMSQISGVQAVEPAPRAHPQSGIGTQAVGAPSWWAAGFRGGTGANDIVPADAAIESEVADPTHPAFGSITVENDPDDAVTDHGTHVGGVIASGDPTFPGVATGIDHLLGGDQPFVLGVPVGSKPGAIDPAETINLSFGSPATSDNEDDSDDVLTSVFGVGQAQAGGNENVDGTPTVNNVGRNIINVAAFNDLGTVTSSDDVVLGVSSRGPTPGGRKKPDLTAPGAAVIAPSSLWNSPASNPDFTPATGTSFSAPHVAGAMTLLEGAGIGDPMAQRALLINSARDWNGSATGLIGWAAPQGSWQPEVGWGELDLTTALAQRGDYQLGSVPEGEAAFFRSTVPTGAKATLAYELRGYFVGYPNPGTQTLKYTQTNLDLRQYLATGAEVAPPSTPTHGGGPDSVDPNDTVEQVRAPAGGPQPITYKVEAASTVEGANAELFAIAAAAPIVQLGTPLVRPINAEAIPAGPVSCGEPVTVSSRLRNDSADLESSSSEVEIRLSPGLTLVSGQQTQQVSGGTLETATTSEQHSWTVQATSDGPKTVTIAGTGVGLGTPFERTTQLTIEADCTAPVTTIDSGPAAATRDDSPTFAFSGDGGTAAFECSTDGAQFNPCASPLTLPSLGDGGHSFSARAVDGAGNADPTPAMRSFTVDTVVLGSNLTRRPHSGQLEDGIVGGVWVDMGEGGKVRITARAVAGKGSVRLSAARFEFGGAGFGWTRLRASDPKVRKLKRWRKHDRLVAIKTTARFSDELGNEAKLRLEFPFR